ncbi:MAG: DNA-processing protein DprA [Alphaproteobacteria bacterium]|nr:DNA-processing protein DprA [Alphaproteobacteria bacterium]
MRTIKLSEEEKIAWLRLIRSENVGSATFESLMRFYEKPSDALKNLGDWAERGGSKRKIKICSEKAALEEMETIQKMGAVLICSCEENYPALLKSIKNPPALITVLGQQQIFKTPAVAFVGARNASLNGKNLTRKMAFDCVQNGISVVSGMALGIDGAAHEGALSANNEKAGTIADLGTGIDVVYPAEHKDLYQEIKERGILVSEFPLQMRPTASNFPRRNRLISGLSLGTLIVEAKDNSGSLITAEFAKEQNRVVMGVPGSPMDDRSVVPNALIKAGAVLIQNAQDIMSAIKQAQIEQDNFFLHEGKKKIELYRFPDEDELKDARSLVLSALSANPVSEDELCRQLSLPAQVVGVILLELELAGRIERHSLGRVSLLYNPEDMKSLDPKKIEWMED